MGVGLPVSAQLCRVAHPPRHGKQEGKADGLALLIFNALSLSQTKSQSNLISRVTSVTEFLPHTQSLHSKQSLYNAAGAGYTQLPAIASRPGSSRPQSRVDILRPMSSRPMSSRPMSGRPMSGRPPSLTQLDQARMEARRSPPRNVARQQSASLRQVAKHTHTHTHTHTYNHHA